MVHLLLAAFLLIAILFLSINILFFDVFILRRLYVELERICVNEANITDRKMLSIPGIERDACEFSCDAIIVEELAFRATYWIDDVVERPVRVLPLIPEPLTALDPVRRYRCTVDHLLDLVGCKARCEIVVRRSRATAARPRFESYLNIFLLGR